MKTISQQSWTRLALAAFSQWVKAQALTDKREAAELADRARKDAYKAGYQCTVSKTPEAIAQVPALAREWAKAVKHRAEDEAAGEIEPAGALPYGEAPKLSGMKRLPRIVPATKSMKAGAQRRA